MDITKLFIYFIIYSFMGWSLEVISKFFQYKRFINRGFLIGPLCTIYGYGVLAIVLVIGNNTTDILSVFLKTIFICSILEYLTSYFMEKIFNAKWWDYSNRKFNINGRVCLNTMIAFGILGCLVIYVVHPFTTYLIGLLPTKVLQLIAIIIFILFLIDNVISFIVTFKLKNKIKNNNKDNTEYIRKEVLKWINNNSILYRRIKNSYPTILINYAYEKKRFNEALRFQKMRKEKAKKLLTTKK